MSEVLTPSSPLSQLMAHGTHATAGGATGVSISEPRAVAQIQVISRKGKAAEAARSISTFLGRKDVLAPSEGAERNNLLICATGPLEHWVFAEGRGPSDAMNELHGIAGASASLFDQSAGRCVIRLAGSHAADVLAKGTSLDLQSEALRAPGASHSVIEHIPALVVRRGDPACYDISVPRSYAGSFIAWLGEAALEYGYVFEQPQT